MSSSLELIAELWRETPAQRAWRMRCAYGLERAAVVAEIWLKTKPTSGTERTYFKQTVEVAWLQVRDALAGMDDEEMTAESLESLRATDTKYELLSEYKKAPVKARFVQLNLFD